jgi:hypothetical protein
VTSTCVDIGSFGSNFGVWISSSVTVGGTRSLTVDYEQSYGIPQAGRFIYGGVQINL